MQHTLVAVFDNRSDAQNAMDELLGAGFSRTDVNLSSADPTGQTDSVTGSSESMGSGVHEEGIGASIKHFFTNLFGADNDEHASRYSDAVTRGHHVVTLTTQSEPEVERAADIIERFGPVDIDERHDLSGPASTLGAATLGTGSMAGAMSASTAGMQQSSSMSAQSQSAGMSSQSALQSSQSGNASVVPGSGALNPSNVDPRSDTLQNAQSASMQRDEDDLPYPAKQDLNDDVPRGTTYQESMGNSQADFLQTGNASQTRTSTGSGSLQGTASLPDSNDMSLGGTAATTGSSMGGSLSGQSLQRGDSLGAGSGMSSGLSRDRVRVYSRAGENAAVDMGGLDDDDYYRNDWNQNYSSLGGSYDDYAPAYRYGSESRSKYSGRNWDDIESDLRSDWDSRYAGSGASTWEKFKAAVKRGWDKITPDANDDDYYRSDWNSNYAALGGAYDDYAPAYRYGSESRGKYSGRNWDDVESDLRTDWDSRYGSSGGPSTWEKFKAAVRHGWDKITPDMDDDDDYYRNHWSNTYGTSGDTYNDYQPAYRYGNEMRRNPKYTGRNWTDVESDLRTDWDTRYGKASESSTWEKMKSAVRHGWDRMTS
nr:general stress protein [uncultured Massilia sp.]